MSKSVFSKSCPRHAAEKNVHFEHVKAAAEKKTVHSVQFNAFRMKSACAEHVRLKKVVMRGNNNNKVLSIDGQLNRPLGHYLGRCVQIEGPGGEEKMAQP